MESGFLKFGIDIKYIDILKKNGILEPTPVQEQSIPQILTGNDVIVQSQTGTGKTLAFLLPILERIDIKKDNIQALIMTPTRELAIQITKEAERLAVVRDIAVLSLYGGKDIERQKKQLKGEPHIVIGTPGRLLDHVTRKTINLSKLSILVLDEADIMISMGFLGEVEEILKQTPGRRQTMLFSATISRGVRMLATHYMRKPINIRIEGRYVTIEEIEQIVVETSEEEKINMLCQMVDKYNPFLAMIFCNTKQRVIQVNEELIKRGYSSDELHGDLSQNKREQVMKRFRDAKIQLLTTTDIAARGIDVEGITHIFNYDIPSDVEWYIHRIGRTGRAGKSGMSITFITAKEHELLRTIENGISKPIDKLDKNLEKKERKPRIKPDIAVKTQGKGGTEKKSFQKKPSVRSKKTPSRG